MRLLDLFCGRWGWSRAFAARGWECWGIDLVSSDLPAANAKFYCADILDLNGNDLLRFQPDFIVASPPCEQFSVHGMKHFHPNPPYPEWGIQLFNHTRAILEDSGVPYVIENVRAAQKFVGRARNHCGPFYLWGVGAPPLLPQGIIKGTRITPGNTVQKMLDAGNKEAVREIRRKQQKDFSARAGGSSKAPALSATIPPELANCVAAYAERLLEQKPLDRGSDAAPDK